MNCSGCGAPLPVDALVCGFCGLHNAVDLLAIRDFKLLSEHSELHCPNGCGQLRLLRLGGVLDVTVAHCTSCNGLHFAPGALQIALDKVAAQVREINHGRLTQILSQRVKPDAVRYKPCPTCQTMMNRQAFSKYIHVVVDECKAHGVWLDSGEFTVLAEWMEAGGRHHIEAEEARRARVAQAAGNTEPIRDLNSSEPTSPDIDAILGHGTRNKRRVQGALAAWQVGLVLTTVVWLIIGWSWPVLLLAAGTVAGWIWREQL
jgi:Zn-finger nucleic acid-binding protein